MFLTDRASPDWCRARQAGSYSNDVGSRSARVGETPRNGQPGTRVVHIRAPTCTRQEARAAATSRKPSDRDRRPVGSWTSVPTRRRKVGRLCHGEEHPRSPSELQDLLSASPCRLTCVFVCFGGCHRWCRHRWNWDFGSYCLTLGAAKMIVRDW